MNTKVTIAGVTFDNPVMVASGTFGSGEEFSEFVDPSGRSSYKRCGKHSVAGKSDAAYCRSIRRYAQCHRSAESGD